jgi:tetratricopeptide (TPR) repeat protein
MRGLFLIGLSLCFVQRGMVAQEKERQAWLFFEASRFEQALELYQAEYHSSQNPELLFYIGECYLSLRQYPEAIGAYRSYLETSPEGPMYVIAEAQLAAALLLMNPPPPPQEHQEPTLDLLEEAADALTPSSPAPAEEPPPVSYITKVNRSDLPTKYSPRPLYRTAFVCGALGVFVGGGALVQASETRQLQEQSGSIEEIEAGIARARSIGQASSLLLASTAILYVAGRVVAIRGEVLTPTPKVNASISLQGASLTIKF